MIVSTKDRKSLLVLLSEHFQNVNASRTRFPFTCISVDCGYLAVLSFSFWCCGQVVSGHPMEMPQHFINVGERMEAVWHQLQVPDTAVVALVGMGGIGRVGVVLLMFWHLWHFH